MVATETAPAPTMESPSTNAALTKKASTFNLLMAPVLLLLLPPFVYYMYFCMVQSSGNLMWPSFSMLKQIPAPTPTAVAIVVIWFALQAMLQVYAPGKWIEGVPLPDGSRLKYKMNGWFSWWATWAVVAALVLTGVIKASILADQFGPLMTVANIGTFIFCIYLYVLGRQQASRNDTVSGNWLYDYWMGTGRNPRVGNFDYKLFCEARPGLIGWVAINLSFAAKQYELQGTVTWPMILVCLFHFWYIADYYYHEEAILTTWDIKHENFGFMLCWGDLVWVPFTYTLQAFYLLTHPHQLAVWQLVGIFVLNFTGYYIFRASNWQKHCFSKDPEKPIWGKKPEYIQTQRGTKLLVSGFWGVARHMNYCGDLMMALAWSLPCLFGSPLPYFYPAYFFILLVHRERRDHAMCASKYGADWDAYCKRVPWRIFPGIY